MQWCIIGRRRLQRAIDAAVALPIDFEVRWRPYFLDPTLPKAGESKLARYKAKFGEERMEQMLPYMDSVGRKEGVHFSYGGLIADTTDSHRLAERAWQLGGAPLQNAVVAAMMSFYFEKEGNLGDKEKLSAAAAAGGMPLAEATALLAGDDLRAEVAEEAKAWGQKYSITGVPFFVISAGGKPRTLSGAQEPETFTDMFEHLAR